MMKCKNCGGLIILAGVGNNIDWVHLETYNELGEPLNCEKAEP